MNHTLANTHSEMVHTAYFAQQYTFLIPAPELRSLVDCYWLLDLRSPHYASMQYQEFIFATLHSSLVFNLGSTFEIFGLPDYPALACSHSVCIGPQVQPLTYRHAYGNFLIGIKFYPAALHYIFRIQAMDLSLNLLPAKAFLTDLSLLEERLHAVTPDQVRYELDALVRKEINQPDDVRMKTVYHACQPDLLSQTRYQLVELANRLCLTPRTLERYFMSTLGVSPKTCLRIARFRRAMPAYASLGYRADYEALGYYDFSHFLKDYHSFSTQVC